MGTFIQVRIDGSRCSGVKRSGHCIDICPVNIFEARGDQVVINQQNEDECTLCGLCLQKCEPQAIEIRKLYDE